MHKPLKKPIFYYLAFIISGFILLGATWGILLVADQTFRTTLLDVISPLVELAVCVVLFIAAKRSSINSKRLGIAWRTVAVAMFFYALGDICWAVLELWLKEPFFPSIADFFYLIHYPVFLVGIFLLPSRPETTAIKINKLIDITIVMAAAILVFWNFLIGLIIQSAAGLPASSQAILLAYLVGDLVVLWAILLILYNHPDEKHDIPILFLAAGLLIMVVSDSVYSYQSLFGTYASGGYLEIGWILSTLLIGLAGVHQIVPLDADVELSIQRNGSSQSRIKTISLIMPYFWLAIAYILLLRYNVLSLPMDFLSLSIAVGGIITLVLVRQVITLFDNQKLNARLQVVNLDLKEEIVERKSIEAQLSYVALHDAMTGLPNRALFLDRLEHAMETTKRHPEFSYAVMFVDLDQFKVVNDSLGHLIGDKLLIMVGKRLQDTLRSSDTVARLGGDEFGILLGIAEPNISVQLVSQKILDVLKTAFKVEIHEIYISASIGIVMNATGYTSIQEILRDADIALYRAKELGRNRSEIFDINMRKQTGTRMGLEDEIRTGLENNEFQLYYQPIIFLESYHLVGFEALIRWVHPKRGLVLPDQFLPIAEESGLIQPISDWVLDEACKQLDRWQKQFPSMNHASVSVNISSNYFAHPNFAEKVIQALQSNGLKADSLKLEITEGVLINNYAAATKVFKQLQDFGVQFQIDDFGTGYSALEYLLHFSVGAIKIDRSFVNGMGKGEISSKLVRAMVSMARDMGMEIIAEGIETHAQLMELKNIICGYGQGYILSKPLDRTAVQKMLARREVDG
ncbi:MAG: EAL domain-containing protein [Chloroflexi bacterium]|nr:EAL domain-containing protein [Chloroflexota bacterium]